jgi:hypothetical protein
VGGTVTVGNSLTISSLPALSAGTAQIGSVTASISNFPASTVVSAYGLGTDGTWRGLEMMAGSNRLKVDAINSQGGSSFPISGSVTIGAGTAQIGSVTASLQASSITGGLKSLTYQDIASVAYLNTAIGSLPALAAGTAQIGSVTVGNSVTIGSLPAISGTVTANVFGKDYDGTAVALPIITHESNAATRGIPIGFNDNGNGSFLIVSDNAPLPVAPALYDGDPTPIQLGNDGDATSPNLVVPIGFAGDGEFKRVAFDAGLPISGTVTIGSLPAISGTVTANTFALQGTAVTTSNFTSTTASTVLASFNATRQVLTIFNEGAGNLHIAPGATCTTIAYQVRLSAGDYYEVPNHQTTITHSAVFATAGTARVTQVT